jgi:hypothetical protein
MRPDTASTQPMMSAAVKVASLPVDLVKQPAQGLSRFASVHPSMRLKAGNKFQS